MKQTGIVTDSTAYLTDDIVKKFNIKVVPLSVTLEDETYAETELTTQDFLAKIKEGSDFPVTSQPSVGEFLSIYKGLLTEGYQEIISIHLSAGISGTMHSAEIAKHMKTLFSWHSND